MKFFGALCIALFYLHAVAGSYDVCGRNERYNRCGTACPLTCENHDKPPEPCILICESGCECKKGYVRHADGSCVRPNQCPDTDEQVCGENERYNECGTACPLTCENYDKLPEPCNLDCESGCECEEGFVKDDEGKCVMPDQCPNKQGPPDPVQNCTLMNITQHSFRLECTEGSNGGLKQHFVMEVHDTHLQRLRANHTSDSPLFQVRDLPPDTGFLVVVYAANAKGRSQAVVLRVNTQNNKQPDHRKDQICGENAHYNECATACPLTCENYDNPPKICPLNCEIGCECDDGFVKHADGKCIRPDRCPNRQGGHQCEYEGKTYFEGEDIPTQRLCLNCKCSPDFVEPNDHVCDFINCPVDKPGCVPVYNDTECCPVSYNCERTKNSTKFEKRYFKHYEAKGCTPEFEAGNDCPKKFNCPKELKINDKACQYQSRLYQIGDKIDTGNPCQICKCKQSSEGLEIACDHVDCPKDVGPPVNDTCREIYEPGKCCAVRVECEKTCEYGGKIYKLGEKIYPEEDPCIICTCTEDWVGISEDSCTFHDCVLENERKKLAQGCLPIYEEATCCPKEFLCEFPEEGLLYRRAGSSSEQDLASGNFCEFKGNRYKVGDVLDYQHPPNAFTCTCLTPPDFTCVRRKCPGPPNGDYENCRPIYLPGGLCPIYDCKIKHITAIKDFLDRPDSSLRCRPGCTLTFIPTPMGLLVTCKCRGKTDYSDGPTPLDNGCPDDYLCQKSCRNRGYKSGKCSGLTCICR